MEDNIITECEACGSTTELEKYSGMMLCISCIDKEKIAEREIEDTANDRLKIILDEQERVDQSIELRTDLFNANTISIIEIQTAVDADDSIKEKKFEVARRVKDRVIHFRKVSIEAHDTQVNADNAVRHGQVYLNDLANQLREDQRAELQLQDINYKPTIKLPTIKKAPKIIKKFDKKELREVAAEFDISEYSLQMICVSKNMTPRQAVDEVKKLAG